MQTRRGFLKLVGKVAALAGVTSVAPSVVLAQKPKEVKSTKLMFRRDVGTGKSRRMGSYHIDELYVRQFEQELLKTYRRKGVLS